MNDSTHRHGAGQTPPHLTDMRARVALLSRRTVIGGLGLGSSLGLPSGAHGSGRVRQQEDSQAEVSPEISTPDATSGTVGIGCIGIVVRDLPASLDFYRRLGLAIPEDAGGGNDYRLRLPNGQVFFWENYAAVRAFDPDWQPSSGNRRVVLEFGFATAQLLDDKYSELASAGYEGYLTPFTFTNSTIRYALMRDPDGNEVGLRFPIC